MTNKTTPPLFDTPSDFVLLTGGVVEHGINPKLTEVWVKQGEFHHAVIIKFDEIKTKLDVILKSPPINPYAYCEIEYTIPSCIVLFPGLGWTEITDDAISWILVLCDKWHPFGQHMFINGQKFEGCFGWIDSTQQFLFSCKFPKSVIIPIEDVTSFLRQQPLHKY